MLAWVEKIKVAQQQIKLPKSPKDLEEINI